MILAFNLLDIIRVPFGWLIGQLYNLTNNYGIALILFAIIVKVVLLPATAKGKKSTMKMSRLTPKMNLIKEKYANDPQKQNEAINALYKEEGISMGGGCLWSLLPLLVLIPLYNVINEPIRYILGESPETIAVLLETLGLPEKGGQIQAAGMIKDNITAINEALAAANLSALSETSAQGINFDFLGVNLGAVPQWKFFAAEWTWNWPTIGAALFPLLSAGGQLFSMFISQKMNASVITNERGLQDKDTAKDSQQAQSNKMMMYVGPVMSLLIGYGFPAVLSLYWFIQGLVTTGFDVLLTKKYRKLYDAEDAARLEKYMAEEALEAEKERIRAERRAANPDGITSNTSKKKMQQAKQKEQEAAKAAAAKDYAMKKGIITEEEAQEPTVLSGIPSRPFCKGRAYDPNRYKKNTTEE